MGCHEESHHPTMHSGAGRAVGAFAAALALLACAGPARAAYHALEELPVEDRLYRDIEDVAASYGLGPSFHETRPWDRADLRAFLDSLATRAPESAGDPAVRRLRRQLSPGSGGWEPLIHGRSDDLDLELGPYARTNFSEDRARRVVDRDFRAGLAASAALGEGALFDSDVYAGTLSPGPHGNPTNSRRFGLIEGVQLNTYFDRAYVTLRGRFGRVHAGHTWLRWGPGVTGGLALSDGARAFDVVEFRVPIVRPLQLEWFLAALDPVRQTYLAGHRIEARPWKSVDCSVAELARFDGASTAPPYLVPVIPYAHYEKRLIKSSDLASTGRDSLFKNNVMWSADVAWRACRNARLYGELVVDDISFSGQYRPPAIGWQLGGHWRQRLGGDAVTARVEYSRVYRFTYSSFHHHDFDFAGFPTGYPLGPDVEQGWAEIAFDRGPNISVGLEAWHTRKGESAVGDAWYPGNGRIDNLPLSGVVDHDLRGALSLRWAPSPALAVDASGGYAAITNLDHRADHDRSGAFGSAGLFVRW